MIRIDWNLYDSDDEIIACLKSLPRYRNTAAKSLSRRVLFFLSLIAARAMRKAKPLFVVLVTNNTCNLNCRYCYGKYGQRKAADYSTGELVRLIDSLRQMGTLLLTLHGGESLLRRDIGEIINYAKLKGMYVSLNTNGYFVPSRIGDILNADAVCISIDGRRECHDWIRGEGSYKMALRALQSLQEHKIPAVIMATLTKINLHEIAFLSDLARRFAAHLQFSILYNYPELVTHQSDIVPDDAAVRCALKEVLELKQKGAPVYFAENVLNSAIHWPASYDKKQFILRGEETDPNMKTITCYHGKLKYMIDADGRVVTCWAHDRADAPNIRTLGLSVALSVCRENNQCRCCAFLSNNEHNSMMSLDISNILSLARIHLSDSLKILHRKEQR